MFFVILALQLVSWFERVWSEAGVNVLVRPYGVLPTEPGAGIIEVIQYPVYEAHRRFFLN